MKDEFESTASPASSDGPTDPAVGSLETAAPWYWKVLLAAGAATFGVGAALALWPRETVKVVAFLLAIHLVLSGSAQIFLALVPFGRSGLARWTVGLAGAASIVLGLLLLFSPMQTLGFIGWAAGLLVLVLGAADLLDASLTPGKSHRGWYAARGVLELAVGLFLLTSPELSLGLLVGIVCVWLISYGSITIFAALSLRSELRERQGGPAGRST